MRIWKKKKKQILKVFCRFSQSLKDCSFDQECCTNFLVCCNSIKFDLGYFAEDQSDHIELMITNLSFSWHIGCNQSFDRLSEKAKTLRNLSISEKFNILHSFSWNVPQLNWTEWNMALFQKCLIIRFSMMLQKFRTEKEQTNNKPYQRHYQQGMATLGYI